MSFGRCVWFCPSLFQRVSINFYRYIRFKSSVNTTIWTKIGLHVTLNLECIGWAIPAQARIGPEGSRSWCSQLYRKPAHGKVVSPAHRPPLPPRKCTWYFCSKLSRTQCHSVDGKIMSIETATFRFVAQCLNQLCNRVTYSRMGPASVLYTQLVVIYKKGLCLQFTNVLLVTVLKFVCFCWRESQENCD